MYKCVQTKKRLFGIESHQNNGKEIEYVAECHYMNANLPRNICAQ